MREMRSKQSNEVKVELVGLPDFMQPEAPPKQEKLKPWEKPRV